MSDYHEGLEEGIKIGRAESAAEITRLRARVAGLEAALRPFADVGEFIAKHHPDPESDQNHETATLVRHFRNAYIALTEGKMSDDADIVKRLSECADQLQDAQYKQMREHITRQFAEIARLRAALATARREGMEQAADLCDDLPDHQGGICAIAIRMMIDEEDKKAAIRAAAKEDREP